MPKTTTSTSKKASREAFDLMALRRENELLKKENQQLRSAFGPEPREVAPLAVRHAEVVKENGSLRSSVQKLQDSLRYYQRHFAGRKSERVVSSASDEYSQLGLYSDEEMKKLLASVGINPNPEPLPSPKPQRKRTATGADTLQIPDGLRRVVREHTLSEEERTLPDGSMLVEISRREIMRLALNKEYFVEVDIYITYAHPTEKSNGVIDTQSLDRIRLIPGSKFAESFMASLIVQKYVMHSPVYRIKESLAMDGIIVSSQTLCALLMLLGTKLSPLVNIMKTIMLQGAVIHSDDTPVKFRKKGKKGLKEGRMWVWCSIEPPPGHLKEGESPPPRIIIYEFSESREKIYPQRWLGDWSGTLVGDKYAGYLSMDQDSDSDVTLSGCLAHARREFEKISGFTDDRELVLCHFRILYLLERAIRDKSKEERSKIRNVQIRKFMDNFFSKLTEMVIRYHGDKANPIVKACGYMLNHAHIFRRFLDNPDIPLDNNLCERAVRPFTIGRKNWLFFGSKDGGATAANIISLIQTCRANGVNPQAWIEHTLSALPYTDEENLESLLPWNFVEAQSKDVKK